jgi:hypothetical protein
VTGFGWSHPRHTAGAGALWEAPREGLLESLLQANYAPSSNAESASAPGARWRRVLKSPYDEDIGQPTSLGHLVQMRRPEHIEVIPLRGPHY